MASWFSQLNLVPSFPAYTGPYKVGTIDVEIPVSHLTSPSPTPEGARDIHTVLFRVYYPATPDSDSSPITWLPAPQRLHLNFYTQFLGLGPRTASLFSYDFSSTHYQTCAVANIALKIYPSPSSLRNYPRVQECRPSPSRQRLRVGKMADHHLLSRSRW